MATVKIQDVREFLKAQQAQFIQTLYKLFDEHYDKMGHEFDEEAQKFLDLQINFLKDEFVEDLQDINFELGARWADSELAQLMQLARENKKKKKKK